MVDIEADIFDRAARAVIGVEPDAFVTSGYVQAPASFPAMMMYEISNITDDSRLDSSKREKSSVVTYQADVYSNLRSGAKQQAREVMSALDSVMLSLNFTRTYMQPMMNSADTSVYRLTARYTAVADENGKLYRR